LCGRYWALPDFLGEGVCLLCFEILFRVLIKDYFASWSTEVIGFSLVN